MPQTTTQGQKKTLLKENDHAMNVANAFKNV
jgi:hypothetical protein